MGDKAAGSQGPGKSSVWVSKEEVWGNRANRAGKAQARP